MLKRIKLENSIILFIGVILICIGVLIGFLDYFKGKKEKAFAEMNILLYENEEPDTIESEEEIQEKTDELENQEASDDNQSSETHTTNTQYDYIGILEIPKINLKRGFLSPDSRYNNVNYNITVIGGSTFPDEVNNNLILAAHSGVCSVCFFDRLFNLSIGDSAYIYYNGVKYSYKISNTYEVEKTGKVAIHRDYSKNTLTLITCTRHSNTKQTVFILELYDKENY